MGELIRNLHEIELGNEKLMVELNEGYRKSQGRVIHIQNSKFRYLLKEKNFMRLAATVLRAYSEMEFMRENLINLTAAAKAYNQEASGSSVQDTILKWKRHFEMEEIEYRLVDSNSAYVTFIIKEKQGQALERMVKRLKDVKKLAHPHGKRYGYSFLYQMKPFELFKDGEIYVELFFQLPSMSLTPYTWIPIDRCVQERVWNYCNVQGEIMCLDDISAYIYRLCIIMFKRLCFSESDCEFLSARKSVVSTDEFKACLEKVFFGFSKRMVELLEEENYGLVIKEYYANKDY